MKIVQPETIGDRHLSWFSQGIYTKSTLGGYKICGEKTRFWLEERKPQKISRHMLEGQCMHKVLEIFNKHSVWIGQVPEIVEEHWHKHVKDLKPGESALLDDRTKSKIQTAFMKYLPLVNEHCLYPRESEVAFGGDGEVKIAGVSVAGHIDLIDRYPSVVDYKWIGKRSRYRKQEKPGIDALIYLKGAESLGFKPKRFRYVLFIRDGVEVEIEVKEFCVEDYYTELLHDVQTLGEGIKRSIKMKWWPEPEWGVGRGLCSPKWCPYWGRCELTKDKK